jgi:large subunit ribosomal protein L16
MFSKRIFKRIIYRSIITNKRNKVQFGEYGLVSDSCSVITKEQIEAARTAINKKIKRIGKLWPKIQIKYPVTKKPSQVRMGKGKGAIDKHVYFTRRHEVLFEISGVSYSKAFEAFERGSVKLPCPTYVIVKS